jgi:hypothetical protein
LGKQMIQKKFNVKKGDNCAILKISGQTYVRIYDEKGMLVLYDKSETTEISSILDPGEYVVETNGRLRSVISTFGEKGGQQLE